MPADHRIHKQWLGEQVDHVDNNPQKLNPTLKELQSLVDSSPRLRMLATSMYQEVPNKKCVQSFCGMMNGYLYWQTL